jgi:hypothetical protein
MDEPYKNLCFEGVTGDAGRRPGNLGCILSLQAYFRKQKEKRAGS